MQVKGAQTVGRIRTFRFPGGAPPVTVGHRNDMDLRLNCLNLTGGFLDRLIVSRLEMSVKKSRNPDCILSLFSTNLPVVAGLFV